MMQSLAAFPSDVGRVWCGEEVFFGCHAQHMTPEAANEILPYHDTAAGLAITADATIDNRDELFDLLGIEQGRRREMPDSVIILQAYKKWGRDCPRYLLGDFAFAIFEAAAGTLFCAVDHAGTRTLYYHRSNRLFAFSTLMRPLFTLPEIAERYCDTWIADFLAIPSVMHQLEGELTLYRDVFLLPAGHTLTVSRDGAVKECYWRLRRQSELKLKTDAEYEEAFRDVLGRAVECRLRNTRPAGVMMSGGLDSTTVACMAARQLAGRGGRLQVFSAVPMLGYRDWLQVPQLADETPYIEAVGAHVANIDLNFCRADGKHPLSDTERLAKLAEQPYKIFTNLFWLDGILAAAAQNNVGVVLNGFAGNATISWGYLEPYLVHLFRNGRWHRLLREAWHDARLYRSPRRALARSLATLLPDGVLEFLKGSNAPGGRNAQNERSPINPDFALANREDERLRQFGFSLSCSRLDAWEARERQFRSDYFSHLSVFTTKLSLAYRITFRDPTVDRRVIEFCHSVPEDQYVRFGNDRFLLRRAMRGILPDKVRLNNSAFGRQDADWGQRLRPDWPRLAEEIAAIGSLEAERKYLDVPRIHRELEKHPTLEDSAPDNSGVVMLVRSLIFSRFLRAFPDGA